MLIFLFLFVFFSFLATPWDMWDLSSLTKDWPDPLQRNHRVLTTGLPGKSLVYLFNRIKENERKIMPRVKRRKEKVICEFFNILMKIITSCILHICVCVGDLIRWKIMGPSLSFVFTMYAWCLEKCMGHERWEGGSGWGTLVHPWRIHVDVWQDQYNTVQ